MPFMSRGSNASSIPSSTTAAAAATAAAAVAHGHKKNKSSLLMTSGGGGVDLAALHQQHQQQQQKEAGSLAASSSYSQSHHTHHHHDKLDDSYRSGISLASGASASSASSTSSSPPPSHPHLQLHSGPPAAAVSPTFSLDQQELSMMLMPDFALAVPTPHDPHSHHLHLNDDMLGTTSALPISHPVRFGALIRLWIAEEDVNSKMAGCGGGGFLGYAAQDLRRIQGELPQAGRFNVGMNDTFFVLPPFKPGKGWHFRETYFRVEEAAGAKEGGREGGRQGGGVRYGEELLLVDEEDHVMCHFRGRKYIRRKPKGTKVREGGREGGREGREGGPGASLNVSLICHPQL